MKKFTLASFNIGASAKMYGRYDEKDLSAISDLIGSSGADVVALQEVDDGCERSGGVAMMPYIKEKAGYGYGYFITIRPFQGGRYGTAIISRFPVTDSRTIDYKVKIAKQGTSCGYVTVDADGVPVTVFNTHLSCESDEANTDTMTCLDHELREFYAYHGGFLCCGDFNTGPDKILHNIRWLSAANAGLYTYADRSIDNILYTGGISVSNVRVINAVDDMTSDHNMLICEVTVL